MTSKQVYQALNNIRNHVKKTPIIFNERLSNKYNCNVYIKREDLQLTRSFKIRGSYNKILQLSNIEKKNGIVCASAGNHAQGFAYICNELSIEGDIFLPNKTPKQKIDRIKYFGNNMINLHLLGDTVDESLEHALEFGIKKNKSFVHPFNDSDIIYGQGTIAIEILDKLRPDIVLSCVGGGGLISGINLVLKDKIPECSLYGCEPLLAPSLSKAIENGFPVKLKNIDTFVDGGSVSKIGEIPYNYLNNQLDDVFLINNGEVCHEMINLYQNDGIIAEPAGCLSICGLSKIPSNALEGKNVVCVLSGGNNDITRYSEIVEKNMIHLGIQHYFIIEFNQKPGELKKFMNNILGENDDINRFEYIKKTNKEYGNVLIGIQLGNIDNLELIKNKLNKFNFRYKKINSDDLIYSYLI